MSEERKQTLSEWETELAWYKPDGEDTSGDLITEEEYRQKAIAGQYIYVDHDFRHEWLKTNGHEINRANMLDITLPLKKGK